ncbi:hypothetical protein SpAn4DRAFT_0332 [Sporomusa ovata]|uniref:Uncharacterized protein n=1 Tax=Sporomusa ovata TaxID=2378 RepID=A0A0U1L2H9_9FIRM|nr:hypothetical protein SpAn4DRAFT_0332 [Sporomusa ovata]
MFNRVFYLDITGEENCKTGKIIRITRLLRWSRGFFINVC